MEKAKATKKTAVKKTVKPQKEEKVEAVPEILESEDLKIEEKKARKYYGAVGRRKNAIARVRLFTIKPFEEDEGKITVNGKFYKEYFPTLDLQQIAEAALRKLKS